MRTVLFIASFAVFASVSCRNSRTNANLIAAGEQADLSNAEKVAETVQAGKNEVVVVDRSLLRDTLTLPLSYFTEELQMVKLEGGNDALVAESNTLVGENHILVKGQSELPYKLFDKSGKFITAIGSYGKGPNEYLNVYDQQLDEKNNRIYLLPWQSDKILVYDLKGAILDPIPLPVRVPKGTFRVDPSGTTVSVAALPFRGIQYVVWTQKISGEVIGGIEPGYLALQPDFSNEMYSRDNTDALDVSIFTFVPRADTLYHYDVKTNRLVPRFTVDFGLRELPIHSYSESTHHYMGQLSEPEQVSANVKVTTDQMFFIVEKSTLKGTFFRLRNDFLGGLEIKWPSDVFSDGYYVSNFEPANLLEILETVLADSNKIDTDLRTKLTRLQNSIKETDNNYIFHAKLKQE